MMLFAYKVIMEINLREVIKYNKKCLQDKTLLRNIIADKYPSKIGEMNVLLNVYDIGVIRDIAHNGSITEWQYSSYVQKLIDTYGLQEQLAIQGLNAWIDVFLGTGYSDRFTNISKTMPDNESQKVIGNIDDYELTMLSDTTAEIKAFVGEDIEDIVVPTEIAGIRIVGIGKDAYSEHNEIRVITIPEGIEYIRACAFGSCESLTEIIIPSTVKEIGACAFSHCYELHTVHLKEGLTVIDGEVFACCESLLEITIPSTVKIIHAYAFSGCSNLRTVQLKEGVVEISSHAFSGCGSLVEIVMPSTIKEINDRAFEGCCNLRTVHLNEGLMYIGSEAFAYCDSICEITIPSTVEEIDVGAFLECDNLIKVYVNSRLIEDDMTDYGSWFMRLEDLFMKDAKSKKRHVLYPPNKVLFLFDNK